MALKGYYYSYKGNAVGQDFTLNVAGIKGKYSAPFLKGLDLAAEYARNVGKYQHTGEDAAGFAFKADAVYALRLAGRLALSAGYYAASGSSDQAKVFTPISPDYRPGIIFGGYYLVLPDNALQDGLIDYSAAADWTPAGLPKLSLALARYGFYNYRVRDVHRRLADETDLTATWTHSAAVSLKGYCAVLAPNKDNRTPANAATAFARPST